MRLILIDWLFSVSYDLKYQRNTLYNAINLMDYVFAKKLKIQKTRLQLLGLTCLYLSHKVEELQVNSLKDFIYLCDN